MCYLMSAKEEGSVSVLSLAAGEQSGDVMCKTFLSSGSGLAVMLRRGKLKKMNSNSETLFSVFLLKCVCSLMVHRSLLLLYKRSPLSLHVSFLLLCLFFLSFSSLVFYCFSLLFPSVPSFSLFCFVVLLLLVSFFPVFTSTPFSSS